MACDNGGLRLSYVLYGVYLLHLYVYSSGAGVLFFSSFSLFSSLLGRRFCFFVWEAR